MLALGVAAAVLVGAGGVLIAGPWLVTGSGSGSGAAPGASASGPIGTADANGAPSGTAKPFVNASIAPTEPPAALASAPAGPARTGNPTALAVAACHANPVQGVRQLAVESLWTTGAEATGLKELLDKFNADNPTLCAYNALIGMTGTVVQDRVKREVLGGTPPDTFQIHAGHELLDQYVYVPAPGPYVAPLDLNILNAADFPAGILKIIAGRDGRPYSVPLGVHRTNALWYSKAAFKKAGIAGPPTSWAEFKTDAEALRAAGITPLAVGDSGIWATGMIFETALISELGADGFEGLWTGATRWDDAGVLRAVGDLKMALSFANSDHASLSWAQAVDMLINHSAAMTIMGDWADTEFLAMGCADYGWAPAPGSAGIFQVMADSFPLPVNAPDPDAAKKLLAYMSTAEAQDLFNPSNGSIPTNLHAGHTLAGVQPYTVYQGSTFSQWVDPGLRIVPSMERGAAAGPAWMSAIEDALTAYESDMNQGAFIRALVGAAGRFVTGP